MMRCRYCGLMDCDCNPQEIHKSKIENALREIIAEEIAEQIWSEDKIVTSKGKLLAAWWVVIRKGGSFDDFWKELHK